MLLSSASPLTLSTPWAVNVDVTAALAVPAVAAKAPAASAAAAITFLEFMGSSLLWGGSSPRQDARARGLFHPRAELAQLGRRAAVGRAEGAREMRRVGEGVAAGDGRDRVVSEGRVEQVTAAGFESAPADEGRDGDVLGGEQLVQRAGGDEVRPRDRLRAEVVIVEVGVDERFHLVEQA